MKLKKAVLIFLIILVFLKVNADELKQGKHYSLSLHYDNGVKVDYFNLNDGYYTVIENPYENKIFEIEMISFDNSILYSDKFGFQLVPETFDVTAELKIPYSEEGKELKVYDENKTELLSIPLYSFVNKEVLEKHDIKYTKLSELQKKVNYKMIILLLFIFIIIIGLIYIKFGRNKKIEN